MKTLLQLTQQDGQRAEQLKQELEALTECRIEADRAAVQEAQRRVLELLQKGKQA